MRGAVVLDAAYMERAALRREAEYRAEYMSRQWEAMDRLHQRHAKPKAKTDARSRFLAGDIDVAEFELELEKELCA